MAKSKVEHRLSSVFSADVVGYSRLMGSDAEATHRILTQYRKVFKKHVTSYDGRIVNAPGDSILAEFGSVSNAVECAVDIQLELRILNEPLPKNRQMIFRIGVNLGDVLVDDSGIYGDGVNIAARLESLAPPGGICVSSGIYSQVKSSFPYDFQFMGSKKVKNIAVPVESYKIILDSGGKSGWFKSRIFKRWLTPWRILLALGVLLVIVFIGLKINQKIDDKSHGHRKFLQKFLQQSLPEKPSIVVLPFDNISNDPTQEYFSDGITEDIITDLSKIHSLFVISRNSSFTYKNKPMLIQTISRELGVRYVLEGSVRKSDSRIRVTAQLIDGTTGNHIWAERYDREMKNVFDLQDEITQKIVSALQVKLTDQGQKKSSKKPTENIEAYDLVLQAKELKMATNMNAIKKARNIYKAALKLDPNYATPYHMLGETYLLEWALFLSDNPATLDTAIDMADKCYQHTKESYCSGLLARAYLWKGRHEQAITEARKALDNNPNNADGYADMAEIMNFTGKPEEGHYNIKKAMRLNPYYPYYYLWTLGHSYFLLRKNSEAIEAFQELIDIAPGFVPSYIFLAILFEETAQIEKSREQLAIIEKKLPKANILKWAQRIPYKNQEDMERLKKGFNSLSKPSNVENLFPIKEDE